MSDHRERRIKPRHSMHINNSPKLSCHSETFWKSDIYLVLPNANSGTNKQVRSECGEYYKRYEHDEIPVKDEDGYGKGHKIANERGSLTNSDIDRLEMKIFKNVSQELQTDDSSISSLDSKIKFFKSTVEQIFENFYASMQDFELYKKRFHEILAKNQEESVADMEDFIKDMIQHIMSSESSISNESRQCSDNLDEVKNQQNNSSTVIEESTTESRTSTEDIDECVETVVEAYKNENYFTDSTLDDACSKNKHDAKKGIFNIYLLSGAPCVQIKMNDRNLLSEIKIKDPLDAQNFNQVASAENIKKLAAKKLQLEKYARHQQDSQTFDREIPVKVSFAKKDIHLNEDFAMDREETATGKSFMVKICNYLCRKFRKS